MLIKEIPWCFGRFHLLFSVFLLGSRGVKILGVLGGFPWSSPKHQGREDQGASRSKTLLTGEFKIIACWILLFLKYQGGPGSVRLRFGDGAVRAVPVFGSGGSSKEGFFLCVSVEFSREDGSSSWKTVPAVPVPRSVPGKTVPTVPVSGSGSVPGPP